MYEKWLACRMKSIEASGIRKIFELGRDMSNPVNLSIGQPHFPVPEPIKQAAKHAIDHDQNGYTVTQGITPLLQALQQRVHARLPDPNRTVMVTSGTSGGLALALLTTVNPGDEVILFEPYFVAYPNLVTLAGGIPVVINTYEDHFQINIDKVRARITPKTKAILFSCPSNPTGVTLDVSVLKSLAELAQEKGLLLISDEIYQSFWYEGAFRSAAEFNTDVLVVDGLGKSYSVTGWRLGYAHGPKPLIEEMTKLQQFTYVCAPAPFQLAAVEALKFDLSAIVADFKRKRDWICDALQDRYEFVKPGGAFYLFPKIPSGTIDEFIQRAISNNLLIIPGNAFGHQATHFRVSFAATDETLERGIEILRKIA